MLDKFEHPEKQLSPRVVIFSMPESVTLARTPLTDMEPRKQFAGSSVTPVLDRALMLDSVGIEEKQDSPSVVRLSLPIPSRVDRLVPWKQFSEIDLTPSIA